MKKYLFNEEPPSNLKAVRIGPQRHPVRWGLIVSKSQGMRRKDLRKLIRGNESRKTDRNTDIWFRLSRVRYHWCKIADADKVCRHGLCSAWSNGDKTRPWWMLGNRSEYGYGIDPHALRHMHSAPRTRKWRKA